ncbi:MAG: hypothetical protein O3A82_14320, partial [Verrucomicrobia bacterium]|nr:hypothetical protein [Verrucomicrobiota bacterium]
MTPAPLPALSLRGAQRRGNPATANHHDPASRITPPPLHTVKGGRIAHASRMTVSLDCRATLWLAMTALGDNARNIENNQPRPPHFPRCHCEERSDVA